MDDEMIERIYKAIVETPNASDYKFLVVRNVLRVMREPTEKMIDAGEGTFQPPDYASAKEAYQAMIDAVINERN